MFDDIIEKLNDLIKYNVNKDFNSRNELIDIITKENSVINLFQFKFYFWITENLIKIEWID